MKLYDVAVLGGGPGGYVCAVKAAQLGLKTALIEKEHLGGICLNWGCIPTKALLRNAEAVDMISRAGDFGVFLSGEPAAADYSFAHKRSREVSAGLSRGVGHLLKKNNVDVFMDEAFILSRNRIELKKSGRYIDCRNLVIAAGAEALSLFGVQPDGVRTLSPRQALALTDVPAKTVIIGAGAIGVEFATIWSRYGSGVTLIEAMDRILPKEDGDISRAVAGSFKKRGIKMLTGCRVEGIAPGKDSVEITVKTDSGSIEKITADSVLYALGVRPGINFGGIPGLNLKMDGNGVAVDRYMRTSLDGVYAVGDITGKLPLAHVASAQGILAAKAIAGFDTEEIRYENIPKCTYCSPETASIGLTEQEALAGGVDVKTGFFPLSANGKALALGEGEGFVKLVSARESGELLGVHMAGAHVTEMIGGMALALRLETTVEELSSVIFPHPTISESIMEAALGASGKAIHF